MESPKHERNDNSPLLLNNGLWSSSFDEKIHWFVHAPSQNGNQQHFSSRKVIDIFWNFSSKI